MIPRYPTTAFVFLISLASLLWTETVGSYDQMVYQVQRKLNALGYDPGQTDGIMGNKTRAAVRRFQRDRGLAVTGKLDEQTRTKLGMPEPPAQFSLTEAVKKNDIENVKALLAAGADVNGSDKLGAKPLHAAALRGYQEISGLLIARGAEINAEDKRGLTPLHAAAWMGHNDIVTMFIAQGADINARDQDDVSVLHVAALAGRKDTAALLIMNGANINAKNKGGLTPLHAAAMAGHPETVAKLLAGGADVDAKNQEGLTPLDVAARQGHGAIVEMLRTHKTRH
jgi:ankyrin repeat protein